MTILLTRHISEESPLHKQLHGLKTCFSPLLDIHPLPLPDINFSFYRAALLTSQNALPCLDKAPRDLPLWTVGNQTALQAQNLGFKNVISANGNRHDLRQMVELLCPSSDPLLYMAGCPSHQDWIQTLEKKGYIIHTHIVYEARAIPFLSNEALDQWENLTAILLFSERSTAHFEDLVKQAGIDTSHITVIFPLIAHKLTLKWKGKLLVKNIDGIDTRCKLDILL